VAAPASGGNRASAGELALSSGGRVMMRLVKFLLVFLLGATAAAAQENRAASIKLSLPSTNWGLEIPATGFAILRDATRPDGNVRYLSADDRARGLNLSVFLERMPRSENAKQCREFYWERLRKSPAMMDQVKLSERGEIAVLEYTDKNPGRLLPEDARKKFEGLEHRHLNAYLAKDGVCIDIHLSKVLKPSEGVSFNFILDGVRFSGAAKPAAAQ
jgi:hypothetical protein